MSADRMSAGTILVSADWMSIGMPRQRNGPGRGRWRRGKGADKSRDRPRRRTGVGNAQAQCATQEGWLPAAMGDCAESIGTTVIARMKKLGVRLLAEEVGAHNRKEPGKASAWCATQEGSGMCAVKAPRQ